jgi:hypothetical protein
LTYDKEASISPDMAERPKTWCASGAGDFPVVATALAVAGCFGEALFQKYFTPGRGLQIALALVEAVPLGLFLRYFAARSRKPHQRENRGGEHVH